MRVIALSACFLLGAAGAYYGQPLAHDNSDVVMALITVITVFAGFLVAIIAVLGDPAMIPEGRWQSAEMRRDKIETRLLRHLYLFIIYLIAIGLLLVGALLGQCSEDIVPVAVKTWIERAYLFFGISSFLLTFGLPHALLKLQVARIDAEIDRRRGASGRGSD